MQDNKRRERKVMPAGLSPSIAPNVALFEECTGEEWDKENEGSRQITINSDWGVRYWRKVW